MASELFKPRSSTQVMLMAVDEDGNGLVSFTELVKSLGIKTHEMLQAEQKARCGEDDHSVEERYGYFAIWPSGNRRARPIATPFTEPQSSQALRPIHVEHRAVSAEFAHLVGR